MNFKVCFFHPFTGYEFLKPLVCTCSYADVLCSEHVDMVNGQTTEPDSAFEVTTNVDGGQTTKSDSTKTAVEQLAPPGKKMKTNTKDRKGKTPGL